LVSLAAWASIGGFESRPTQLGTGAVLPSETLVVRPATASWSELRALPASRRAPAESGAIVPDTLEVSPLELGAPVERRATGEPGEPGGVERIASCPGVGVDPSENRFDAGLDVPDGAGFSFIPPDAAGAVGPRHLLTMLANQVTIQDREGGSLSAVDTSAFWSPLGTTPSSPTTTLQRAHYDARAARFFATAREGPPLAGTTRILFAITRTDDPTGTWDFYSFTADPGATSFADWVVSGYNDTWIAITANMFLPSGSSLGAKMWAIDKSTALVPGGPLTVSVFATGFMTSVHGSGGTSLHPARTLDGDATLWMVNDGFTSVGTFLLQLTRITGTGPAPVVSGLPGSPFGGTSSLCYVATNWSATQRTMAQLGESRFISPFSTRVASVAVRSGVIWVANSGGLPGPSTNASPTSSGVLWHELDPSLPFPLTPGAPGSMVLQSGAITNGPDTACLYPSLAVNCAGDVLIGFANGDATLHPRACYALRLGTDPLGAMGPVRELAPGESRYWKNFGAGTLAQYGRYTSAAVDPCDDTTLWTLQEFADARVGPADNDSRWGTCWGSLGSGPRFFQVDFYGTHAPEVAASTWGDLEYTLRSCASGLYLNAIAREDAGAAPEWIVQNMMLPAQVAGLEGTAVRRFFDLAPLGVSTGLPLVSLEYQLFLTDVPFAAMPLPGPVYASTHVASMDYEQDGCGEIGSPPLYPSDPGPGPVVETGSYAPPLRGSLYRDDVPDIEEGRNECCPVAVTRSLRWMDDNGMINLGLTTNAQLIACFKAGSNWSADHGGVPSHKDFLKAKLKCTKDLNIVTKFMVHRPGDVPPGDLTTNDGTAVNKGGDPTFQFIKHELKHDEDVEIFVGWIESGERKNGHCMTVIGFEEDASNGKKEIWVQDNDQTKTGDKDRRRSTRYEDGNPPTLKDLPGNRVEMVVSESPGPKKGKPKKK
jgi:hypothetical protein